MSKSYDFMCVPGNHDGREVQQQPTRFQQVRIKASLSGIAEIADDVRYMRKLEMCA